MAALTSGNGTSINLSLSTRLFDARNRSTIGDRSKGNSMRRRAKPRAGPANESEANAVSFAQQVGNRVTISSKVSVPIQKERRLRDDINWASLATLSAKSRVARKRSGSYCTSSRKCRSAVIRAARSPPISQFPGIEMMRVALYCGDTHTPLVSISPAGFFDKIRLLARKRPESEKLDQPEQKQAS